MCCYSNHFNPMTIAVRLYPADDFGYLHLLKLTYNGCLRRFGVFASSAAFFILITPNFFPVKPIFRKPKRIFISNPLNGETIKIRRSDSGEHVLGNIRRIHSSFKLPPTPQAKFDIWTRIDVSLPAFFWTLQLLDAPLPRISY
jgi:hypothetical protein